MGERNGETTNKGRERKMMRQETKGQEGDERNEKKRL